MKKYIAALALALVSGLALAATEGAPQGGHKPPPAANMKDALGLTDEQVQKMREIRDGGGTREEMQQVLTPEQRAKATNLKKEHRGERPERKARMQQQLDLSDEQMKKMEQIRKDGGSREELRAVLTPEQQTKFDAMRSKHEGKRPAPAAKSVAPPAAKPVKNPAEPSAENTTDKPTDTPADEPMVEPANDPAAKPAN